MPKMPRGSRRRSMSRDASRLFAALTSFGAHPVREQPVMRASSSWAAAHPPITVGTARPTPDTPVLNEQVALWARALLVFALAAAMTQWPYAHACGVPLYAYLGAVGAVLLAGAWITVESWNLRSAPAHVLGLIIVFWGLVLAAEQALPRMGYAADPASWTCPAGPSAVSRLAVGEGGR